MGQLHRGGVHVLAQVGAIAARWPEAAILVTGCYAELEPDALSAMTPRTVVLPGSRKGALVVMAAGIADAARRMGVPVRIIYFSNAEEYFKAYTPAFRNNVTALPADEKSLVLRTVSVQKRLYPWSPDSEHSTDRGFHYNIMGAKLFQDGMLTLPPSMRLVHIMKESDVLGVVE